MFSNEQQHPQWVAPAKNDFADIPKQSSSQSSQ
jgi:hypothetical protein